MTTQAELLQRERDRESGVSPKKKIINKPSPGSNRGANKQAIMDELGVKRLRMNQTTDSNQ